MGVWFLAATNGFYDDRLGAPPKGAVLVSKSTYQSLLAAQEHGAAIVADAGGAHPIAQVPRAPPAVPPPAQASAAGALSVADRLTALEHGQSAILQHLGLHL